MLRDFKSFLDQCDILKDSSKVERTYDFFADTVKGDALDNWIEILQDDQIYQFGVIDMLYWTYILRFLWKQY